jgi:hypothetical protein
VTNSLLSTTIDPSTAQIYLGTSSPDDQRQSILFEIELNLNLRRIQLKKMMIEYLMVSVKEEQ